MDNLKILLSVHAFIVCEGKVLLLRRSAQSGFGAGLWEMPGGKPDITAKDLMDDVIREIGEETAMAVTIRKLLTVAEHRIEEGGSPYSGFRHVLLVYLCDVSELKTPRLSEEHYYSRWAGITDLDKLKFMPIQEEVIRRALNLEF